MKASVSTRGKEKNRWISLSRALQRFFADNDIWILKIADGVDNIKIDQEINLRYYNQMLNEVFSFNYNLPAKKQIHLMALRSTTFNDACKGPLLPHNNIEILVLDNTSLPLKEIWSLRYDFIRSQLGDDKFKSFCTYIRDYISNISEIPYNYNVRDFLHNKLSLAALSLYRCKQLNIDISDGNIGDNSKRVNRIINSFEIEIYI